MLGGRGGYYPLLGIFKIKDGGVGFFLFKGCLKLVFVLYKEIRWKFILFGKKHNGF